MITLRLIPDDPSRKARMVNAAAFREAFDRCAQGQSGEVIAHPNGVAYRGGSEPDDDLKIQIGSSGRYFLPEGTHYLEEGPYSLSLEDTLTGLK